MHLTERGTRDVSRRHHRHARWKREAVRPGYRHRLPGRQTAQGLAGPSRRPDREGLADRERRAITGAVRGLRPRTPPPRARASGRRGHNATAGVLPGAPSDPGGYLMNDLLETAI